MKKENSMNKKCMGCGAVLQTSDEKEKGYIPEDKYDNSDYYQRCFKLIHYNKRVFFEPNEDNNKIIDIINKEDTYVFFLTDFFNISKEVIKIFKSIKVLKTLVISKSDLIPKSVNKNRIINKLKDIYGLDCDIIFIGNKDKNFNFIDNNLKKYGLKTCHILGFTNSGKSTFVNKLDESNRLTTSNMPNTTLDFVTIPYHDFKVVDAPGFTLTKTLYDVNDNNLIKRLNPKYYIKPKVFQTKDDQIYNIEDKLYFNFGNNDAIFYMSNLINIKKMYKSFDIKFKEINIDKNSDIVIPSLGFINVKKEIALCVNSDLASLIEIRNSIF